ncbi:nitrile hydratase accessory protein [Roseovarius spongiae]|uniref:Nitrile hydratase accessory protein n=1 Tax=Roseovarius spongiae TaxID=2320272 RepID=A0A3A8AYT9_9RHOB|nr:nitrile hydratase accessory protein [Roseovarius spongiae]RKF17096.1 nitrile hydratase accessory protein [Roseovarius spongiae]
MTPLDAHRDMLARISADIPGRSDGGPLFRAPWQARIFALIVALAQAGRLPWRAFQARLAAEITEMETKGAPEGVEDGYFDCWLRAAGEAMSQQRLIAPGEVDAQIDALREAIQAIRSAQTAAG